MSNQYRHYTNPTREDLDTIKRLVIWLRSTIGEAQ